jgi:eukaryotic-like serine/threonine-protein kinase
MSFAVVGEVIAGRYELQELVGVGGMSNVYRARDLLLERMVALKLLHDRFADDEEYVERFRREARSAARLSHPGIVTVIDRGEQDGHQYIVFEHVPGETLKQLVDREGPLPVDVALDLALQMGRALAFAHERGLIHRDVKPQNVLLNGDRRAKVTDFGIARVMDVDGMTTTGAVVGTSHYMAPEQAKGEQVDAQSDVYGLGAVLYELLSGGVPFPGDNFVTVAMRHVNDRLPSLLEKRPELPLRLVAAVERALEKDPTRRFPTMTAFVDELEICREQLASGGDESATQIIRGPAVAEEQTMIRRPEPQRRRRSTWPLILIIAGLALGAIAAGIFLFGDVTNSSKKPLGPPIPLEAVSSFDPFGDNHTENDGLVGYAADGDLGTAWTTERYFDRVLTKKGVGIVVAAKRPSKPTRMTVWSSTPGFTAVIKAGDRSDGGFTPISEPRKVGSRTIFALDTPSPFRYFLLWITNLGGQERVDVNEVKAR